MNKCVLVIGSACVDVIIHVDHLPDREENLHPIGQQFRLGGCACNTAYILGSGNADVTYLAPVGMRGVFGPWVLAALTKLPWVHPVCLEDEENGCCYCLVEPDGERTFMSIHGAEYSFSAAWMLPYRNRTFDYAYVCGLEVEEKNGDELVSWLESAGIRTLLYAPGPRGARVPPERTKRIMDLHPVLHLNGSEAMQMAGQNSPETAVRCLAGMTGNAVIVTLGADGAMVLEPGGEIRHIPGVPDVQVVDTIGAGDSHAGAVLLGLSRGYPLDGAVRFANRVAAMTVAQEGAVLADVSILRE